jgi:predicted metal-dependent peptidase
MSDEITTDQDLPKEVKALLHKIENMEKLDVHELYGDAINYLDYNFAYFLTHVLNIGKPRWHAGVGTAMVAIPLDEDGKAEDIDDFHFLFRPDFAQMFQLEEYVGKGVKPEEAMAFILAHETMHILLNHLKLCQQDRFDDKKRFNWAADCVINDYLVNMGLKPIEDCLRGESLVGYNCANATVSQVYRDIPEDASKGSGNEGEGQGAPGAAGDGQYPGKQLDNHDWMHDSTEKQQEKADEAGKGDNELPQDLDRTKQDDDFQSDKNPGQGVGSKQSFTEDKDVGLKWAKLLEKVDPFFFKKGPKEIADWSRRPRKIAAFPEGRVNLPVNRPRREDVNRGTKPAIVMALDTSGSIGHEQANQFVNMARSIPQDKIKLHVCTFTTQYLELDLYAEDPEWASGGTSWDPITQFIEEKVMPANRKRYPSAVVVVTDGYASFRSKAPDKKQAESWFWLITPDGRTDYGDPLPGTVDELDNFQKGAKNA